MTITFKKEKTQKIFNSEKLLRKEYGKENAKIINRRMAILKASVCLDDVPKGKPDRCHPLHGDRSGQFAVDLKHPFRLIFEPDHDPVPRKENGEADLTKIISIKIIGVEDYH